MAHNDGQTLIDPLVADIITASLASTHAATTAVIDNLTAENEKLRATIDLMRYGIESALDGYYMPMPSVLLRMLRPSDYEIEMYKRSQEA